jgi:hypothetical protein
MHIDSTYNIILRVSMKTFIMDICLHFVFNALLNDIIENLFQLLDELKQAQAYSNQITIQFTSNIRSKLWCFLERVVCLAAARVHGAVLCHQWVSGRLSLVPALADGHRHSQTLHLSRSVLSIDQGPLPQRFPKFLSKLKLKSIFAKFYLLSPSAMGSLYRSTHGSAEF